MKNALAGFRATRQAPLEWFPNKKRWLAYGRAVIDRAAGKVVAALPETPPGKDPTRHVFGNEHVLAVGSGMHEGAAIPCELPAAGLEPAEGVAPSGGADPARRIPKVVVADWSQATKIELAGDRISVEGASLTHRRG